MNSKTMDKLKSNGFKCYYEDSPADSYCIKDLSFPDLTKTRKTHTNFRQDIDKSVTEMLGIWS